MELQLKLEFCFSKKVTFVQFMMVTHILFLFFFFVFQVTAKFAIMFITVQYNVTHILGESDLQI